MRHGIGRVGQEEEWERSLDGLGLVGWAVVPAHGRVCSVNGPAVAAYHEGHPDICKGGDFGHVLKSRLEVFDGFFKL